MLPHTIDDEREITRGPRFVSRTCDVPNQSAGSTPVGAGLCPAHCHRIDLHGIASASPWHFTGVLGSLRFVIA